MIYPSLTDSQMKKSQRLFIAYNLFNGLGFLCVGGTVMTLLINRLGFPDYVFTIYAALFNIGCIWLPLGKIATQKWGAARTQSNFWFLRNFASLLMGSCAVCVVFGYPTIGVVLFFTGAFVFYGCRAAGGVMTTALVGNITTPDGRGKLLAFASMANNIVAAVGNISLTVALFYVDKLSNNHAIMALYGIIIFGSLCGMFSALCLRNIDESDALKKAAQKPLIADAWVCLKSSAFRRMAIGHVCFSLAMAFTTSLNMLVLKRGFQIPDSFALAISFISSMISVAVARPVSIVGDKFGPRKGLIIGYCFTFLVILFWQVVPASFNWASVAILVSLTSCCSLFCGICFGQYFLKCIPVEHQPSASTLNSLINGVLTGFIAMLLTTLLWNCCDWLGYEEINMLRYRVFFRLALPFVGLGLIGVWMQKEV